MSRNADDKEEARAKKEETNKKVQEELANDEEKSASKQLDRDQLEMLREKLQRKYH
jgi:hypothetical protein